MHGPCASNGYLVRSPVGTTTLARLGEALKLGADTARVFILAGFVSISISKSGNQLPLLLGLVAFLILYSASYTAQGLHNPLVHQPAFIIILAWAQLCGVTFYAVAVIERNDPYSFRPSTPTIIGCVAWFIVAPLTTLAIVLAGGKWRRKKVDIQSEQQLEDQPLPQEQYQGFDHARFQSHFVQRLNSPGDPAPEGATYNKAPLGPTN